MSRACSGMLSSEKDDFKFLKKTAKKHKMHVRHVHHSFRACVTVLSHQTSLLLTRNMNVTVAKELYYIFCEISKLDTGNFSLTLSINGIMVKTNN